MRLALSIELTRVLVPLAHITLQASGSVITKNHQAVRFLILLNYDYMIIRNFYFFYFAVIVK